MEVREGSRWYVGEECAVQGAQPLKGPWGRTGLACCRSSEEARAAAGE